MYENFFYLTGFLFPRAEWEKTDEVRSLLQGLEKRKSLVTGAVASLATIFELPNLVPKNMVPEVRVPEGIISGNLMKLLTYSKLLLYFYGDLPQTVKMHLVNMEIDNLPGEEERKRAHIMELVKRLQNAANVSRVTLYRMLPLSSSISVLSLWRFMCARVCSCTSA